MNGKGVLEVGNNGGCLCFIGCYGLHLPESGKGVWELRRYGGSLLLRGAYSLLVKFSPECLYKEGQDYMRF